MTCDIHTVIVVATVYMTCGIHTVKVATVIMACDIYSYMTKLYGYDRMTMV